MTFLFTYDSPGQCEIRRSAGVELSRVHGQAECNVRYKAALPLIQQLLDQAVRIGGETFKLAGDEAICTEYSYKYDLDEFRHNAVGFFAQ